MKPSHKTWTMWLVLIIMFGLLLKALDQGGKAKTEIKFSEFISRVKEGKIEEITVNKAENLIAGTLKEKGPDGKNITFETVGDVSTPRVFELMEQNNLYPNYARAEKASFWQSAMVSWLPMLIPLIFLFMFMRHMQSGGGKAMSFGKSRARKLNETTKKVTFKEVAGADEAKYELEEIVEFLKDPKKFTRLGGRIPKGVLLMGPPGTGKTLLARAVAGEANVPFFSISGSDFVEMFVGVGASRVRDLFEQGKKEAPCIIFIDEIDAVGRHRGAGVGGGHDEREQTLNQLLVEMDGFEGNEGIILVAATNRPDVLDPALLRPGRFDRRIVVSNPDLVGREAILKVHTRKTPLAESVNLEVIARGTPGFSGADLENLVNEAALLAARKGRRALEGIDLEEAKDKVMMGAERRSVVLSEKEKRNTAYHEAGHALIGYMLPNNDPVHKITIIPRGMSLGATHSLPREDRKSLHKEKAEDLIAMMMGGRAAEELIFNERTTGAGNDIERATDLARRMVCEWGMSDILGPLTFGKHDQQVFLGRDISQSRDYSEQTAQIIDREVRDIAERNYRRAYDLLSKNIHILHRISESLMEHETINGDDLDRLVRGLNIERPAINTVNGDKKPDSTGGEDPSSAPAGGTPDPMPA